uniref:Putative secreted protein n=1 Tax=Anopheles darlingi TaxID=43151 RepID=A0A2M4D805_ANODA
MRLALMGGKVGLVSRLPLFVLAFRNCLSFKTHCFKTDLQTGFVIRKNFCITYNKVTISKFLFKFQIQMLNI